MTKLTELKARVYLRRFWTEIRDGVFDRSWHEFRLSLTILSVFAVICSLIAYAVIYNEKLSHADQFIATLRFSTWGFFFHIDSLASYPVQQWGSMYREGIEGIAIAGGFFLFSVVLHIFLLLKDVIVAVMKRPEAKDIARYTAARQTDLYDELAGFPSYIRRDLTHIGALLRSHEELLEPNGARDDTVIVHFNAEVEELTARANTLKEWQTRLEAALEQLGQLRQVIQSGLTRLLDAYEQQRTDPHIREVSPALIRDIEAATKKLCFYLRETDEILSRDYRGSYPAAQFADVEDLIRGIEAGGNKVTIPAPDDTSGDEMFDEDDL